MISRRALFAALLDRHFGNGAPTWRISRGKSSERPCDTFAEADDQRDQLVDQARLARQAPQSARRSATRREAAPLSRIQAVQERCLPGVRARPSAALRRRSELRLTAGAAAVRSISMSRLWPGPQRVACAPSTTGRSRRKWECARRCWRRPVSSSSRRNLKSSPWQPAARPLPVAFLGRGPRWRFPSHRRTQESDQRIGRRR